MRRSARLTAREAESCPAVQQGRLQDDARPAIQQGQLQEDDPLHPWCFCQQPNGGNFMIMCDQQGDNCHKWYHGKCVGISPGEGRQMEANNELYICPSCSQIPPLPKFSPSHHPDFLWNSCLDGTEFCDRISTAYNQIVHW